MIIDFEVKQTFNQQLDIVDPGNCCIKCENDSWSTYYLVLKTIRGLTHVFEYGPIAPDSDELSEEFCAKYSALKFNEKKIFGKISSFLNDPKKEISSAIEDLADNAFDDFPDLAELFQKLA